MVVVTRRLCGALGAEVSGVDLSTPLDEDTARSIVDAFHEHLVLVFRGQSLAPAAQIAFTRLFGSPYAHPLRTRANVDGFPEVLILETRPGRIGARNDYWHSDISHQEYPPAASILHALVVPDGLGDTMFCNMYRAVETLSPGMRRLLDAMEAMHSAEATMRRTLETGTDALPIDSVPPPRAHPVLRTHPHTGRRALFVNPHFTVSFAGMTKDESAPLLDYLAEHSTRPENIYRHRWTAGDVLVWDNRCTMHYAVRDYDDTIHRKHHRTTASGERPFRASAPDEGGIRRANSNDAGYRVDFRARALATAPWLGHPEPRGPPTARDAPVEHQPRSRSTWSG